MRLLNRRIKETARPADRTAQVLSDAVEKLEKTTADLEVVAEKLRKRLREKELHDRKQQPE